MTHTELRAAIAAELENQLPEVAIQLVEGAKAPTRATDGSAGYDLYSAVNTRVRRKGNQMAIPTGVKLAIPPGWEAQIRSRSGLAMRHSAFVINSPGTIDSDFRGEIMVHLMNLGQFQLEIRRGDRIAQLVFNRIALPKLVQGSSNYTGWHGCAFMLPADCLSD